MSFLSLSPIGSMASNDVYQIGNNQRATFKPNLWESGSHQANVRKYSKNLMLIHGKPEIRSEAKLSETELIRLKQSPARQKLSETLAKCYDKVFNIKNEDTDLENIIMHSQVGKSFNFVKLLEASLKDKTGKIIQVIQGINSLDTANMTEKQMENKVKEYSSLIDDAKNHITSLRNLLYEGAQLAIKSKQTNKNELNPEITKFQMKFTAFVENSISNSENKSQKPT